MDRSLKLIGFHICPFVQKARIAFALKGLDVPIEYIDLARKPRWFLDLVPTGKVPALLDNGMAVFESNVILEYADEIAAGRLLPADPLDRARERAWMVYADELIMTQYRVLSSNSKDEAEWSAVALFGGLARLEGLAEGRGPGFGLLECAIAPLFSRIDAVPFLKERFVHAYADDSVPAIWAERILAPDAVRRSLPDRFAERLVEFFGQRDGFLFGGSMVPA